MANPKLDLGALLAESDRLKTRYAAFQAAGLALDMTRGKPCPEQLDLSLGLMTILGAEDYRAGNVDCRNYGGLDGLAEAKAMFAPFLGVNTDELIVMGNSSLNLMHDTVTRALSHGVPGGESSWQAQAGIDRVKFVCPAPGYDRHFAICEHLGIEMITVDSDEQGPNMDAVEALVKSDPLVKGMWVVPKYGNPTGVTVSDNVVDRLARMPCAAPDFRIMWDNAYAVHHLVDDPPPLKDLLAASKAAGNENRPLIYGSTSKISFSSAGVALMGGTVENMNWMRSHLSIMTIGPDKLNQLRHVRFFKHLAGIEAHMLKHAAIIRPKFELVETALRNQLTGVATWTKPQGGYFISLDTPDGCAKRTVELAKAVGVAFTSAGATFPYGKDPRNRNIRIAPTLPSLTEIETAMDVFCTCVKLAALEAAQ